MNKIGVVFGIAASGKDTLLEGLVERYPFNYKRIVNDTTRRPRPNEVNDENYHFITDEEFEKRKQDSRYITHNFLHGRGYGVLYSELVSPQMPIGHFGETDINQLLEKRDLDIRCIGLIPPSYEEWQERIKQRLLAGLITADEQEVRTSRIGSEIKFMLHLQSLQLLRIIISDSSCIQNSHEYLTVTTPEAYEAIDDDAYYATTGFMDAIRDINEI